MASHSVQMLFQISVTKNNAFENIKLTTMNNNNNSNRHRFKMIDVAPVLNKTQP